MPTRSTVDAQKSSPVTSEAGSDTVSFADNAVAAITAATTGVLGSLQDVLDKLAGAAPAPAPSAPETPNAVEAPSVPEAPSASEKPVVPELPSEAQAAPSKPVEPGLKWAEGGETGRVAVNQGTDGNDLLMFKSGTLAGGLGDDKYIVSNIEAAKVVEKAGGGIDTSIDPIALHHQLTLHSSVPAPRTLLNGIRKLPQAHWMRISAAGDVELKRYWELDATRPDVGLSEQDWLNAMRHVLKKVVERHRLAADVPVGVLLSGGLDSSLIVALLADHVPDLRTFSIGFEDIGGDAEKGDEFEYSDQVVARYHTQHHKMLIPNSEVLKRLPEAVRSMSEPMVSQDNIAFYLLAEQVSKDVKVVLAGQGADEVFGGYFWYPKMDVAEGSALDKFRNNYFDRDHAEYLDTVSDAYRTEDVTSELVAKELAKPHADEFLDQVLRFDVSTLVVDDPVKRMDNMSMAWGLEARVPFLDHELVELAAKMPPSLRLKEGGKFPLKAIARGLIPDSVIDRPKGYFPVPALKYVRGEFLQFMRDILLSDACQKRGLFNQAYVGKLLAEPESHFTRLNGSKLWHLALLEYWLQLNVDKAQQH